MATAAVRANAAPALEAGLIGVRVGEFEPPFVTTVDGQKLLNFSHCCYLETSTHPAVVDAAVEATRTYGVQLSVSPTYMAVDLYDELAGRLAEVTGRVAVVASTTTLGHFGTLPGLVDPDSLVVVDRQAHNSLQMTCRMLAGSGVEVTHILHSDLEALESLVASAPGRPVWYVADGVYSMFGDVAPFAGLRELADRYENLWIYLDDAHGLGWSGLNGRGLALEALGDHPRVVVIAGLSKSWGAGGAVVALPSEELAAKARFSPGPFMFSGPLKPAELGAAIASADLHLSAALDTRRSHLYALMDHVRREAARLGLQLVDDADTPIFFVRVGDADRAIATAERLRLDGFFVNVSAYPVVPRNQAGIRFTLTSALTTGQVSDMLAALAGHVSSLVA